MIRLDFLKPLLLSDLSEEKLVKLIQVLSENFTSNRKDIERYLSDENLVSAYTYFYFPTNGFKLEWALQKIKAPFFEDELQVIDIGCGPGTYSYFFKKLKPKISNFVAFDKSSLMLNQAKKIWDSSYNPNEITYVNNIKKIKPKTIKRLLVFGHSLNEMEVSEALEVIKELDGDYLFFIEPGTKEVFSKILEVRKKLIDLNYKIEYPCPNDKACPMEGGHNWCHQYVVPKYELDLERLQQLVKLDRKFMPVIFHFYSKEKIKENKEARIVQTYPETKFSLAFDVCFNDQITHLEILKRNLTKEEVKELSKLYAGDEISFEIDKIVSDKLTRAKKITPIP